MKPLLVFDLDGTLIDSARDIATALNTTLARYQKPQIPYETVVAHIGEGLRHLLAGFFTEYKDDARMQEKLVREFLDTYEAEMFTHTRLFEGVENFFLNYDGPIGIITNKNEAPARMLVEKLGLGRFPWVQIYGADSLAERKPSPLPLQTMMNLAGRSAKQTVMIGDGTPDMASAKAAGVHAIAIDFGYTHRDILKQHGATVHLSHYDELPSVLKSLTFEF